MGKNKIAKGVKFMGIAILCMFVGPVVLSIGFKALRDDVYNWLIFGIVICITAIVLAFVGIGTITKGIFEEDE